MPAHGYNYAKHRDAQRVHRAKLHSQLVEVDGLPFHPDPPGGHGTATAYNLAGCRCESCREGAKTRYRERRDQLAKQRMKPAKRDQTVNLDSVFTITDRGTTGESAD